jgi:hypothetical protein
MSPTFLKTGDNMTRKMNKDGVAYDVGGIGIHDLQPGDVVKVGPNRLETVVAVEDRNNRSGNWQVQTQSGRVYTGWDIGAYGRRSEE